MFSMLIEVLLSLMKVPLKIWRRSCYTLWTFGLTRLIPLICWQMPVWILQVHRSCQLSCHPSHLNLCSVHLTIFLVVMLGFLVVKLPPCLSKHLFGKLLSQGLYLQLCEILLLFFFKGFWHSRNLLFLLFGTLHGFSQKKSNILLSWSSFDVLIRNYFLSSMVTVLKNILH